MLGHPDRLPLLGDETKLPRIDIETFRDDLLASRSRALSKAVMTSLKAILKQAKQRAEASRGSVRKARQYNADYPQINEVELVLDKLCEVIDQELDVAGQFSANLHENLNTTASHLTQLTELQRRVGR